MARLDFANARIGARRAALVGAAALRELLSRASLEARVELLRTFPVGAALPDLAGAEPIGAIERALRLALRREALALAEEAEGRKARALLLAVLSLDEAAVVKAVLRAVARGGAVDRAFALAPALPVLPEEALREAAAASSLETALDALAAAGSALAAAVRAALPHGRAELLALEIAVDRAALERARRACRRRGQDGAILAGHLADRADARNAATLLALGGAPVPVAPWVPGGRRWAGSELDALSRAGLAAARAAVAAGFPGSERALDEPWGADRALERALLAQLRRDARRCPLSIAVPLAYLAARAEEVRRVALVLRGAAFGLPGDEILDLVEA